MMTKIELVTQFDITPTGIKSYRKTSELSDEEWSFQRNQQRNYETILQCLSLRCQPLNISPVTIFKLEQGKVWGFTFETDRDSIFFSDNDPVGLLKDDCDGVPMIGGLQETYKDGFFIPYLVTRGESANISFAIV